MNSKVQNLIDAAAAAVVHMRRMGCSEEMAVILEDAVESVSLLPIRRSEMGFSWQGKNFSFSLNWRGANIGHPFAQGVYRLAPETLIVDDVEIPWLILQLAQGEPEAVLSAVMSDDALRGRIMDRAADVVTVGEWDELMAMQLSDEVEGAKTTE